MIWSSDIGLLSLQEQYYVMEPTDAMVEVVYPWTLCVMVSLTVTMVMMNSIVTLCALKDVCAQILLSVVLMRNYITYLLSLMIQGGWF